MSDSVEPTDVQPWRRAVPVMRRLPGRSSLCSTLALCSAGGISVHSSQRTFSGQQRRPGSRFEAVTRSRLHRDLRTEVFDVPPEVKNLVTADGAAVMEADAVGTYIRDFAGIPPTEGDAESSLLRVYDVKM
jgi:hypothetical protein